jgi:hypothetical protein
VAKSLARSPSADTSDLHDRIHDPLEHVQGRRPTSMPAALRRRLLE